MKEFVLVDVDSVDYSTLPQSPGRFYIPFTAGSYASLDRHIRDAGIVITNNGGSMFRGGFEDSFWKCHLECRISEDHLSIPKMLQELYRFGLTTTDKFVIINRQSLGIPVEYLHESFPNDPALFQNVLREARWYFQGDKQMVYFYPDCIGLESAQSILKDYLGFTCKLLRGTQKTRKVG